MDSKCVPKVIDARALPFPAIGDSCFTQKAVKISVNVHNAVHTASGELVIPSKVIDYSLHSILKEIHNTKGSLLR